MIHNLCFGLNPRVLCTGTVGVPQLLIRKGDGHSLSWSPFPQGGADALHGNRAIFPGWLLIRSMWITDGRMARFLGITYAE